MIYSRTETIGVGKCQGFITEEWGLLVEGISPIAILFLQIRVSSCEGLVFIAAISSSVRWMMVDFCIKDAFMI